MREILFKFLFEMKNDLNDLKNLVFELIHQNDLRMPDSSRMRSLKPATFSTSSYPSSVSDIDLQEEYNAMRSTTHQTDLPEARKPIIIEHPQSNYNHAEVVDENLNMIEMEKDLILKALKKHAGRRKDAATDLGISERTLYRKIKEYELG